MKAYFDDSTCIDDYWFELYDLTSEIYDYFKYILKRLTASMI